MYLSSTQRFEDIWKVTKKWKAAFLLVLFKAFFVTFFNLNLSWLRDFNIEAFFKAVWDFTFSKETLYVTEIMRWSRWGWGLYAAINVVWPIADPFSGVKKELIWTILIFPLNAVWAQKEPGAVVRDRINTVRAEIRLAAFPVYVGRRFAPVGFGWEKKRFRTVLIFVSYKYFKYIWNSIFTYFLEYFEIFFLTFEKKN